jgi:cell division protein FtsB
MESREQKIQYVFLIVSTVAAVLAVVVPFLTSVWELWSKINKVQEQVGELETDHRKTVISLEREIGELRRAKAALIERARRDTNRFRALEQRFRLLEAELDQRVSPLERRN